jgi:hypothetical protein
MSDLTLSFSFPSWIARMRRPSFLTLSLCLLVTPAAAWTVTQEKDRMTDKVLTWASATSGDATLLVGCLNGRIEPRIAWDRRMGFGSGIGVSWRMDNGPMQSYLAGMFSQDGTVFYPWTDSKSGSVMRAKRVRVSIGKAFYDFDTAAGKPLPTKWGGCPAL